MHKLSLKSDINEVKYVGEQLAKVFYYKDIFTINDLFNYFPRKYLDFNQVIKISELHLGLVMIAGKIKITSHRYTKRGLSVTTAYAIDDTSMVPLTWFNRPYLNRSIKSSEEYYIYGEFKLTNGHWQLINPSIELKDALAVDEANKIMPIYKESKLLSSKNICRVIKQCIDLFSEIKEWLPNELLHDYQLMPIGEAYSNVHLPSSSVALTKALNRLKFNELFPIILANKLIQLQKSNDYSHVIKTDIDLTKKLLNLLPFKLTDDQRLSLWQIYKDMARPHPMNRLLEGDTGSGKSVVAVMAAVLAISQGYKAFFIAPTEILAKQHLKTIESILKPLKEDIKVYYVSSSTKARDKKIIIEEIKTTNQASIIVGTHSLLNLAIPLDNLGLLIIDEQHRFGVDQRLIIQKKSKYMPHFLALTATPIPRTLALTVLSEMSVSRITQKPKERLKIISSLVYPSDFNDFIKSVTEQLKLKHQIYIVCPNINKRSADQQDRIIDLLQVYDKFKSIFSTFSVGFIHGKLSDIEQVEVMQDFIEHKIDILVATTIIEVGVDVPNATIMAIYGPEHFGLATLHQLRGRVGRANHQSYCYLILSAQEEPINRLKTFIKYDDGFKLSEFDLTQRGPGAIYGKLQHGKGNNIMFTLDDPLLLKLARDAVSNFISNYSLDDHPLIQTMVQEVNHITYLN